MITAVVSRKGGVGKTTTTVNLAAAIAGIGKRVLLIDLDSQGSASLSLGVPRARFAPSIADVLFREATLEDTVRQSRIEGLDLVTSSADLASFDVDFAGDPKRELQLARALRTVRADYDFVFMDCPSSLSLLPINALVAADCYIVPVVPNHLSLVGLPNLLATVGRLYRRFDKRTALLGIAPTLVDYRLKSHRENLQTIRREYGDRVFAIEIRVNTRLAEAPAQGQSVFEYDAKATGARAYRLLAAEVLMRATSGATTERDAVEERSAATTRIAS